MRINITGKHRTLSDSLKEYIEKEVTELTHYYERIIEANVVLEKEGKNQVVAINLRVAGQTLISENRSTNMRAAIDSSVDKLAKQLVKYKQKWQRKGPKSPEEQPVEAEAAADTEEPMLPEEGEAVLTFEEEDQAEESTTTGL